jgi:hypothetical protein
MREPKRQKDNRRATRRLSPRRTTQSTCFVTGKNGTNLLVSLLDLSLTGARLVLNSNIESETGLVLTLASPLLPQPLHLQLQVMWTLPLSENRLCMGVQFQEPLASNDLEALTNRYAGAPWMFPACPSPAQPPAATPGEL